jgi:hypothetical protein
MGGAEGDVKTVARSRLLIHDFDETPLRARCIVDQRDTAPRPRMLRPGNRSALTPCRRPRVYELIRGDIRHAARNVRANSPQLERAGGKTRGGIAPPDFRLRTASAWHTRPSRGIPLVHEGRRHVG